MDQSTCEVETKYQWWPAIIDHILEPLGGRQPIAENNCDCVVCREDLAMFHVKHKEHDNKVNIPDKGFTSD
jgi:hypothetical protein